MAPFSVRILSCGLVLLALLPLAARGQETAAAPPLRLRPGDAVRLEVRDEPGLAGDFQIDESGHALLPLIELVPVAERDFEEVRRDISARYARELQDPVLRLTPLIRVAVLGEVRAPGLYPVDPTYTLVDVLALAGGFTPSADQDRVTLVRDGVVVMGARASDPGALQHPLRSGDQIVIERRGWIHQNSATLIGAGASLVVAVVTTLLLR